MLETFLALSVCDIFSYISLHLGIWGDLSKSSIMMGSCLFAGVPVDIIHPCPKNHSLPSSLLMPQGRAYGTWPELEVSPLKGPKCP